jgi:hypothetical protein
MSQDPQNRRQMTSIDPDRFQGEWTVVAGQDYVPSGRVRIRHLDGSEYLLEYQDRELLWRPLQTLFFMPDTGTLENRVGEDGWPLPKEPERCLTFWNRAVRNRAKLSSIFAMRIGCNPPGDSNLPGFETGPNGSWGAEEG